MLGSLIPRSGATLIARGVKHRHGKPVRIARADRLVLLGVHVGFRNTHQFVCLIFNDLGRVPLRDL